MYQTRRKRYQFSIRSLLILMTLLGGLLAWWGADLQREIRRIQGIHTLLAWGGTVQTVRDPSWRGSFLSLLGWDAGKRVDSVALSGKQITDESTEILRRFPELRVLRLFECQVTNAGFQNLAPLEKLEHLDIHGTQITDAPLSRLANLPRLSTLVLDGVQLTKTSAVHLGNIHALNSLGLVGGQVDGESIRLCAELPQVAVLVADDTRLNDDDLLPLKESPHLQMLFLDTPGITDASIPLLGSLQSLKSLTLVQAKLTPEGQQRLRQMLPETMVSFH